MKKRIKAKTDRLELWIEPDFLTKIKEKAQKQYRTVSEITRLLLLKWLENNGN